MEILSRRFNRRMAEDALDDVERYFLFYHSGRHGMPQGVRIDLLDLTSLRHCLQPDFKALRIEIRPGR